MNEITERIAAVRVQIKELEEEIRQLVAIRTAIDNLHQSGVF